MGWFSGSSNKDEPLFEDTPDYLMTGWSSFKEGNVDLGIEKSEKFLKGISKKDGKFFYSTPDKKWFWEMDQQNIDILTNNLAVMYKAKGNLDLAEQMWKTVSHLHYAQFNLAELARSRSNLQEAKLLYRSAARFGNYTGLAINSYFLSREGKSEEAKEEIDTIVNQNNLKDFLEFIVENEKLEDQLYMHTGLNACNILLNDLEDKIHSMKEFVIEKRELINSNIDKNYDYDEFGSLEHLSAELDQPEKRSHALKMLIQLANDGNEKAVEVLEDDALKRENLMEADHWATKKKDLKSKIGSQFGNLATGLASGLAASSAVSATLPTFLTNLKGVNEYNKFTDRLENLENEDLDRNQEESTDENQTDFGSFFS